MLKSIPKASVFIACLVWSGIASAAGLGGINVTSSLGQPLKAEIEVVAVDKGDKSSLKARLASADAYKNAGVDYPYSIPKLTFQIEERADGEPYVKVTTSQPVNDPFVTLMVELSWASGKLMREYTFLLDPPGYKPEQPQPEAVTPVEPVLAAPVVAPAPAPLATASEPVPAEPQMETPAAEAASAVAPAPEGMVTAAPAEVAPASAPVGEIAPAEAPALEAAPGAETVPAEKPPVEKALTQEQPAAAPAAEYGLSREEAIPEPTPPEHIVVMRGDTLTKIAAQIKPADVSLERMLVSLYRQNAGIFDGHNMNRIRAGKILTVPSAEATRMLPQADAEEEIRAQAADWNAYRQKLAAVHMPAPERAEKQEASGKISAAVTDQAIAKAPAKEVLRLSKGEAPSEKGVGGGKVSAEEKAAAKEEEAIAASKALKEAEERTAILEKNVQEMQRLEELKKESAPASAPTVAVPVAAASAPQPASAVAPAKPKKAAVAPPKVVEQPSVLDQLLSEPLYLAAGAVVLLALGGLGFMVARRGKQGGAKKKVEEVGGTTTGRIAAPIAPSPETGDFTHAPALAGTVATPEPEEVDPIGEADLFLTFGRDVQAEEVLKEALKKNPNNLPVKLKLLSIYSNRKDTNSFYSYAREIKDSGDAGAWEQTAAMGRELEPSNPFYGGTGGAAAPAPEVKAPSAVPAVDFDLGFGAPASAAPAAPEFGSQSTIVMETPTPEKTTIMTAEEMRTAAQATPMDFDITGTNPNVPPSAGAKKPEAAELNMGDLVFDVTATHPQAPLAEAAAPAPAAAEDTGLTFTLDFPLETSVKPAAPAPDLGLGEISLDLDKLGGASSAGAGGVKDEHWQEVATKLDLAKAYQEMGDAAGAREILEEVLRDGDAQQRESAQTLMQQL